MKRRILLAVLLAFGLAGLMPMQAAKQKKVKKDKETQLVLPEEKSSEMLDTPEKMPEYPGGQSALVQYLSMNVRYPYQAYQKGIQGKVIVTFVVDKDGSVTDVRVEKPVHKQLDKEAVRVVKKMPKWIPGEQDGKPVRVLFHLPVNFSLH